MRVWYAELDMTGEKFNAPPKGVLFENIQNDDSWSVGDIVRVTDDSTNSIVGSLKLLKHCGPGDWDTEMLPD